MSSRGCSGSRKRTPTASATSFASSSKVSTRPRRNARRRSTNASSTTTSTRASRSISQNPRDDLTTFLLEAELDGEKLHPDHVRGTMVLLMIAGIDTTWSAIGASLWHLAQHPDDRARLAADPSLMPTAVEEFLRAYAPVTMARLVAEDFDFHGCPMKQGDWLLLPFPAANRDPDVFPDADHVIIDRAENRHAAFGLGIHRCLGSNLARMELQIALEEWMKRYPDFELAAPDQVAWSAGQVRGPARCPYGSGSTNRLSEKYRAPFRRCECNQAVVRGPNALRVRPVVVVGEVVHGIALRCHEEPVKRARADGRGRASQSVHGRSPRSELSDDGRPTCPPHTRCPGHRHKSRSRTRLTGEPAASVRACDRSVETITTRIPLVEVGTGGLSPVSTALGR